jgi:DNA-binding NarL/FixJ family response regulator
MSMSSIIRERATPTPREQELILLIARGLQNKVIAYELNISENTVQAHISNIMRKYGLHNRTQIAVLLTAPHASLEAKLAPLDFTAQHDPSDEEQQMA